jgi:polyisoprenoid-binding protein YceI
MSSDPASRFFARRNRLACAAFAAAAATFALQPSFAQPTKEINPGPGKSPSAHPERPKVPDIQPATPPTVSPGAQAAVSASGKSLVVPEKLAKAGAVYHALPDKDRQVFFTSTAPAETIEGTSNKVIGFVVAGPKDNPAALKGGEWHLPVKSIKTGNTTRDGHLAGEPWLNAAKYPDVVFQLDEVKDIKPGKSDDKSKTFTGTLVGKMTIHGVTKLITIPDSTITFMPSNDETAKIAKGDLVAIRSKFSVMLSDYGVKNTIVGKKVAEEIKLDDVLYMSTVPPEQQS